MQTDKKPILLFDWDGTIVDSNDFKWNGAWQLVFEGEEDKQKIIREVFTRPQGRVYNRWELVRETLFVLGDEDLKDLEGEDLRSNPKITKYTDKFKEVLATRYDHMPPLLNAKDTLEKLHKDGYRMYVISNSEVGGLNHMAESLDLSKYFIEVMGLPNSKYQNFEEITLIEKTSDPKDYIFIGDGENDKALALKIGCRFIGISNKYNNWNNDSEMAGVAVNNLSEVIDRV